jgi:DNA-binding MarR family transcriptional regulator
VDQATAVPVAGQREAALPAGGRGRRAEVASVADSVIDLLRTVRRSKARMLAVASDDIDSATQLLLRTVATEGPMRASALAVSVQSDLSTVSRQVAALVARGLLERRADPVDGRACLLVVTDAGQAMIAEHEHARTAFFEQVLSGWPPGELGQFVHLLERFTRAYDTTHTQWMADATRHPTRNGNSKEGSTT